MPSSKRQLSSVVMTEAQHAAFDEAFARSGLKSKADFVRQIFAEKIPDFPADDVPEPGEHNRKYPKSWLGYTWTTSEKVNGKAYQVQHRVIGQPTSTSDHQYPYVSSSDAQSEYPLGHISEYALKKIFDEQG